MVRRAWFSMLLTAAAAPCADWFCTGNGCRLKPMFEMRGRYESRTGVGFGRDPDIATGLIRTRLGLTYTPFAWLKVSGMVQDSRAPWYGPNAPSSVRDPADLHEAWFELSSAKTGLGAVAGRMMLNCGEGRLIGTPQWGNLARTYDHARVYWKSKRARLEVLMVSPVKIRIGEFNRPVLGDRVWGTYNVFPDLVRKSQADIYLLRRNQNRPGGFQGGSRAAGTDAIGITTVGFRVAGPIGGGVKYSVEGAVQRGTVGPARQRGAAWFTSLSRQWTVARRLLDVSGEYKYASGTEDPSDSRQTGTFDQLYPANHDKFGHQDLFGWRNLHHIRGLAVYALRKDLAVNFMYSEFWMASARDALYNGAGQAIARSADGAAGRHVGREADLFGTYRYGRLTFGAGYGHFVAGGFVRRATPGIGPTYLYVFHSFAL
jgi:hypothetical protein